MKWEPIRTYGPIDSLYLRCLCASRTPPLFSGRYPDLELARWLIMMVSHHSLFHHLATVLCQELPSFLLVSG